MHDIDTVRLEMEGEGRFNHDGEEESTYEGGEESFNMEAEEELLAAELLGVSSEAELDQFLGKLFKNISRKVKGVGSFLSQHAGPLGDTLKGIAKSALPTLGAALGTAIPIPGVGTALGGMVGNAASQLLEAELEGENLEDREFEVAKQFVHLAANTAKHGARMPAIPNRRATTFRALRSALHQIRNQRRAIARLKAARRRLAGRRHAPSSYGGTTYVGDGTAPDSADDGDTDGLDAGGLAAGGGDDASAQAGLGDPSPNGAMGSAPSAQASTSSTGEYEVYQSESQSPIGGLHSGRWVRRGRKIILYGV